MNNLFIRLILVCSWYPINYIFFLTKKYTVLIFSLRGEYKYVYPIILIWCVSTQCIHVICIKLEYKHKKKWLRSLTEKQLFWSFIDIITNGCLFTFIHHLDFLSSYHLRDSKNFFEPSNNRYSISIDKSTVIMSTNTFQSNFLLD